MIKFLLFFISTALLFPSCASAPMIQPQINGLVAANKFDYAVKLLKNSPESYGSNNYLLYLLDYGLVLHLSGRYQESIPVFEEAKKIYDQMYTVSLRKEALTWLVNDNYAPYRGEDFERVLINIFQALNFAILGNINEALVEARNANIQLSLINRQYPEGQKNRYKEDAFARFLMGILYEAGGTRENINDALISYKKALQTYGQDYESSYKVEPPQLLIENLLASAQYIDAQQFAALKNTFLGVKFETIQQKKEKAEVYLIHYDGLSPIKHAIDLPIPLPNGLVTVLAFPNYNKRIYTTGGGVFKAVNGRALETHTVLGEDIGAIAEQNLVNRGARVVAKAALRAAGKIFFEQKQAQNLNKKVGGDSSGVFRYLASLYNIVSEQPDLRSWQTLPAEIRIARLTLDPGEYQLFFNAEKLPKVFLNPGETKFFVVRTTNY